ncbi:MAG: hypothetical protein ACUVTD_05725 [Nitrososphaerales archaeon]
MSMWFRCAECGHEFQARSRYVSYRQCGQCYSTNLEELNRVERRASLLDGHLARDIFLAFDKGKNPIQIVEEFALDPKVVGYAFTWYLRLKRLWAERDRLSSAHVEKVIVEEEYRSPAKTIETPIGKFFEFNGKFYKID